MLKKIDDSESLLDTAALAPLQRFVERECRLLDEQRFEEWLALFAGGTYWAPATRDNPIRIRRYRCSGTTKGDDADTRATPAAPKSTARFRLR